MHSTPWYSLLLALPVTYYVTLCICIIVDTRILAKLYG